MADARPRDSRGRGADTGPRGADAAGRQPSGNPAGLLSTAEKSPPRGPQRHGDGQPAGPADLDALWKLATWLSPAYPIGAFAYSHGLEAAIAAGDIADAASAAAWISDCIEHGAGRADTILLVHGWRAEAAGDSAASNRIAELAAALAPSAERLLETQALGAAFAEVTGAAWGKAPRGTAYPVALGRAAAQHGIALRTTALLFLHGFASSLVSACVRLVPLGQTEGQRALAGLMPLCERVAAGALTATLDEIGGCAFRADIAAMRHETQPVRLFRT